MYAPRTAGLVLWPERICASIKSALIKQDLRAMPQLHASLLRRCCALVVSRVGARAPAFLGELFKSAHVRRICCAERKVERAEGEVW